MPLTSPECPWVSGTWQATSAIFLGSIGPQSLRFLGFGEAFPDPYAARLQRAIDLGAEEWQAELPSGLPFSSRPIALVHCDSEGDARRAQRALDHLESVVKSPLIFVIGDNELAAVTDRAVATRTALICLDCVARSTETSFDQGLIWRLKPALEQQAPLAAWRVGTLEEQVRRERGLAAEANVRLALVTQEYPGITAFGERVRSLLRFNAGRPVDQNVGSFFELRTPDPLRETVGQLQVAQRIVDFGPDIIVVGLGSDFTTYYLRLIEDAWPEGAPRPYYVATSLNQELGLLAPIVGADEDLRRRISGTGLFIDDEVAANSSAFASRFRGRYQEDPDNVQVGYDGFYTAAYAMVIGDRERRVSGPGLAEAFADLISGPRVRVGPDSVNTGVTYLLAEQSIDLSGSSSALDWSPVSREITNDVTLWCLERTDSGELVLQSAAGARWDHVSGEIVGAYECK